MKTLRLIFILILICSLPEVHAQKVKRFKTWITLLDDTKIIGILHSANEIELLIMTEDLTQLNIDPKTIETIKLRREKNVGKGAWIGALGGLAAGAIAGYVSESGSGWEDVGAVGGGILGAPIGSLLGMGVSSIKEKYIINGNEDTYHSFLPKLQQYTLHKNI